MAVVGCRIEDYRLTCLAVSTGVAALDDLSKKNSEIKNIHNHPKVAMEKNRFDFKRSEEMWDDSELRPQ
jgi:hypothetical protein